MQKNPVKAIREKCIDCAGGSVAEVRTCPASTCALHPFRFGKNPYRTPRTLTEAQRQEIRERLANGKESKAAAIVETKPTGKRHFHAPDGKDTTEQESPAERITDAEKTTK